MLQFMTVSTSDYIAVSGQLWSQWLPVRFRDLRFVEQCAMEPALLSVSCELFECLAQR